MMSYLILISITKYPNSNTIIIPIITKIEFNITYTNIMRVLTTYFKTREQNRPNLNNI
jgi:hypothetical protein